MVAATTWKAEIPPNLLFIKVFPRAPSIQLDSRVLKQLLQIALASTAVQVEMWIPERLTLPFFEISLPSVALF